MESANAYGLQNKFRDVAKLGSKKGRLVGCRSKRCAAWLRKYMWREVQYITDGGQQ